MFLKDAILFWVLHYGSSDSRTSRSLAMISVHLIFRYTDSSAAIAALCISVESFFFGITPLSIFISAQPNYSKNIFHIPEANFVFTSVIHQNVFIVTMYDRQINA